MNKSDCENKKISSRTMGFIILPLAIALSLIGGLVVPVVGMLFALPLFILSFMFIAAPDSKACRLILGKNA